MIRHWQLVLCAALPLCIGGRPMAAQETHTDKRSVHVYLTASGKSDASPVVTLSQLSAFVDKQPAQPISLRSANDDKLLFAVLVDVSMSDAGKAASIKQSALQLYKSLLDDGNQGHLVLFNDRVSMSKNPNPLSEVEPALDGVHFKGGTALYDALADTCTRILSRSGNPETPRRAIFLFTDGLDNASLIDHQKTEEIAEDEGVAIFSLQTGFSDMSGAEVRHAVHFLEEVSQDTGGRAIEARKMEEGVQLLLKAAHEQWVLDLAPSQTLDQKMHSFEIKSSEKNVQLSAPVQILLQ
jgi:von Willebrand factor type A domain